MTLRYYQKKGRGDIYDRWEENDILMFVLATGGGKTVTFTEILRDALLKGKRGLLVAHRQELITQAWQTLYENKILAGVIMSDFPETFERPIQVGSVQTLARRKNLPEFDYIIIDEGHHAQKENGYGALLARYPDAKVLLVTATPYRLSGEGFEYIHKYKKTSLIINKTLKQLMEEAWLVPIKYFIASVPDLSDVNIEKGDYVEEDTAKAMELAPLVDSYIEHADGKRGVVFTVNIAHSKQTVDQYNFRGIPAAHLDANTPSEDYVNQQGIACRGRKGILADFRSGLIKVISNVGIITEGFDFPDLEFVQLARPTKSLSMFLQMVGRGTRAIKGIFDGIEAEDQAQERFAAIMASKKTCCIVLDNAGCWLDHNMPDYEHDWVNYFRGTKGKKKEIPEDEMEMLVFIAESASGETIRTLNAKEIEGMKLIEVTKEQRRKVVNIKSIKEFDRMFQLYKRLPQIRKAGYVTFHEFFKHCERQNIIVVDQIWEYMHTKLLKENKAKIEALFLAKSTNPENWPDDKYAAQLKKLTAEGVSEEFFKEEYRKYCVIHKSQIDAYILGN